MTALSWIFWSAWIVLGAAFELFAVLSEKRLGTEPLTRVVRDRLMRRSTLVKLGVTFFLFWWLIHWTLPLSW